jgi:hypothetical protein
VRDSSSERSAYKREKLPSVQPAIKKYPVIRKFSKMEQRSHDCTLRCRGFCHLRLTKPGESGMSKNIISYTPSLQVLQ